MLSIIVAIAKNNVIGKDNKLIWHLPDDLKHFKNLTLNHTIIMGRKTFESLGRVLPKRKHIVFSKNKDFFIDDENVEVVHNISEIQQFIDSEDEVFVIGGAKIYELLMPYAKKMYITKINHLFDGDTFFPDINETEWKVVGRAIGIKDEKNNLDYEYIDYARADSSI